MTLTITHAAAEGTLIDGTSRGDGTSDALKANGWRWSRAIGSWYIPYSRDREPKTAIINRTAEQLAAAGFAVEISIDYARRATTDVEADLIERRSERADALADRATRRHHHATEEAERAARALRRLPEGGEPIKIGHHSEAGHRRAIAKADAAIRRSIDADSEARRAQVRADIAASSNDARYATITVANRIEKLRADIAGMRRRLDGSSRTLAGGYIEVTAAATGAYAERLERELAAAQDQLSYWQEVRAEQIASGAATDHNKDTINVGDQIRYFGSWCTVTRVNPKSVSITDAYGHRGTVPYTHIREHSVGQSEASS